MYINWHLAGEIFKKYVIPMATTGITILVTEKQSKENAQIMAKEIAKELVKEGVKA